MATCAPFQTYRTLLRNTILVHGNYSIASPGWIGCGRNAQVQRRYNPSFASPERQIMFECLTHDDVPGATVGLLTLNRAKAANSMGKTMLTELQQCLDFLEQQDFNHSQHEDDQYDNEGRVTRPPVSPRCIIVTSASNKVFSAGADLKERATMTLEEAEIFVNGLRTTFDRLASLSLPSIAAIEGVAVGGGLELAMAADIRVASETALLGLPETSLAIVPGAGGTQRLPRLIGMARSKELIWTGKRIDGTTANEYGLVQHVVESGNTLNASLDIAWKIAKNGPIAIAASKFAIERGMQETNMTEALAVERQAYGLVLTTKDRLEGLAAFKEGRPPQYRGH